MGNGYIFETGWVTITVQFEDGTPLPDADVYIVDPYMFFGTTDLNGQVKRCGFLSQGSYLVRAIFNDSQFGNDTNLSVDENGAGNTAIVGSCVNVTIHVQDSNGDPLSGYTVQILNEKGEQVDAGLTDDAGNFNTCLTDGDYRAIVVDPMGNVEVVDFTLPGPTTITVIFDLSSGTKFIHNHNHIYYFNDYF